nr:VCBS repeat-containing protein [Streptomyces chartreusis]
MLNPDSSGHATTPGLYIRYNTGNGFAPAQLFTFLPDWGTWSRDGDTHDNAVRLGDMDGDGRTDVVLFHGLLRNGAEFPVWRGSHDDFGGATILFAQGGYQEVKGSNAPNWAFDTWYYSQLGDFNGDGRTDIVSFHGHTAKDSDTTELRYYEQGGSSRDSSDLLIAVSDTPKEAVAAKWPREQISYSSVWSSEGRGAAYTGPEATFPVARVHAGGMAVVRAVESTVGVVDASSEDDINARKRRIEYSFDHPMQDLQGRGFLGFGRMTVWDSQKVSETVTRFDNTTVAADASRPGVHWYPKAGLAQSTRTATAVWENNPPKAGQDALEKVRVSYTDHDYENVSLNHSTTHYTRAKSSALPEANTRTYEWEEPASFDGLLVHSDNAHPRTHIYDLQWASGPGAATHFRLTKAASQADAYNNITRSETAVEGKDSSEDGGLTRTVTEYDTDPARIGSWLLSLPKKSTTTKSELVGAPSGDKTSVNTVGYSYDDQGRPTKQEVNKDAADADLRSTTTTGYGDHGEIIWTKAEASTAGTKPRETHYSYAPLAGLPDERIYPTQVWSTRTDPADQAKRPSAWTLTHPSFGTVSKTADINGVTASFVYDDLDVISLGQSAETYEGRGDGCEGKEVFRLSLVAAMQAAAAG